MMGKMHRAQSSCKAGLWWIGWLYSETLYKLPWHKVILFRSHWLERGLMSESHIHRLFAIRVLNYGRRHLHCMSTERWYCMRSPTSKYISFALMTAACMWPCPDQRVLLSVRWQLRRDQDDEEAALMMTEKQQIITHIVLTNSKTILYTLELQLELLHVFFWSPTQMCLLYFLTSATVSCVSGH